MQYKKLRVNDFGRICDCEYQIVYSKRDDRTFVLIKQSEIKDGGALITSVIEHIANAIYEKDLNGVDPEKIIFIEYYPKDLYPNTAYEFAKQVLEIRYKDQGIVSKLLDLKRVFTGFDGPPNAVPFRSDGKITSTLKELGFTL